MNSFKLLILILLVVSCKAPEARKPEQVKSGSFIQESAERNKKLNEREQQQIEKIITQNPEHEYIASESGFWYHYHNKVELDSITAGFGDIINFNYDIKDLNGNVIYSKEDLGTRNYTMDQEEIFTGLREGLKLLKPSESATFLFPSQKAYGYYGDNDRIGINIPLMVKVEINTIKQNE